MSDQERLRITRRQLIIGAAALAGSISGAIIYDKLVYPKFLFGAPESQDLEPKLVKVGVFEVSKGINIRTSPRIPNKTRFRKPDNRINWDEIETLNGAPLAGQSAFLIINPPVVEGQDTFPGLDAHDWIKLMIKKDGEDDVSPCYINYSFQTRDFISLLGYAGYAEGDNSTDPYGYEAEIHTFLPEDIGRVIIPENAETVARDIMPKLWAERMRRKFDGELGLEDKILTNVQVVAAGSEVETMEMLKLETPVNLREYPSLQYGNGEPVNIVGKISQGTIIRRALVPPHDNFHYRFAAVRSEDIGGLLLDSQGKLFTPPAGEIYAIYLLYLSTV